MLFAQLMFLLLLLVFCSFVPGFLFVSRLRWTPLEKLCGSIGLSLALIYLAAWTTFCFGPKDERIAFYLILGIAVVFGLRARSEIQQIIKTFRCRQAILGYGFLLLLTFLMLGMIRVYSGAGWASDWQEHFQRSLFFLHRLSPQTVIESNYSIPARPPMMNVLGAFFLGLAGDRYELFQVTFGFLNLLVFFPCLLLAPSLWKARRHVLPLTALFAASPVIMENVTYTWTKALAGFYVVLGLCLYLAGLRKNDSIRIVSGFIASAAGLLVHYSAGPYVLFLALHYTARFFQQHPRPWRELAVICGAGSLFLLTWFGWSVAVYGASTTLTSNTSVRYSQEYQGSNVGKIVWNMYASIVPLRLRGDALPFPEQERLSAALRDEAFVLYQMNLIFGLGLVGGPLVLWLLYRTLGSRAGSVTTERSFWRLMVPFCTVVGIAVVGEKDIAGTPHLTLLPLQMLGLALLASSFFWLPRNIAYLMIAGCVIDFSFGVFLQAGVESLENGRNHTVFGTFEFVDGKLTIPSKANDLTGSIWMNWFAKHRYAVFETSLREMPQRYENNSAFRQTWPQYQQRFRRLLDQDVTRWGGWFGRNGGVIRYLGDWVAGESANGTYVVGAMLLILFFAPMFALYYQVR
jgi:hypothetical protein